MKPIVHGLKAKYGPRIDVMFLSVTEERNDFVRQRFGIELTPSIYLIGRDGTPVRSWIGMVERDTLDAALQVELAK